MLHVLNTIGSRKVVLEAEIKEIDDDIAQNTSMARKYGDEFFTEGSARLAQTRVRATHASPPHDRHAHACDLPTEHCENVADLSSGGRRRDHTAF